MVSYILAAVTALLVLGCDQFTKYYVSTHYAVLDENVLIPKVLNFLYIKNDGGAWGMLSGYTWILLSVTIVVMLVCIAMLLKSGIKDKLMFWAVMLILSGGVGNMIDRIFRGGKVIDFLQFGFWTDFPIFNIADCAIVIGAGLMLLYFFVEIIRETRQKRNIAQKIVEDVNTNEEN